MRTKIFIAIAIALTFVSAAIGQNLGSNPAALKYLTDAIREYNNDRTDASEEERQEQRERDDATMRMLQQQQRQTQEMQRQLEMQKRVQQIQQPSLRPSPQPVQQPGNTLAQAGKGPLAVDANRCLQVVQADRGTACGSASSLSVRMRNVCQQPIHAQLCVEDEMGRKRNCGSVSKLQPGSDELFQFTCKSTGRYHYWGCSNLDPYRGNCGGHQQGG